MGTDKTAEAAMTTLCRDLLRRQDWPFAEDCEHDVQALPVIDFRFDYRCHKCHGFGSFNWGVLNYEDRQAFWALEPSRQLALLMRREVARR